MTTRAIGIDLGTTNSIVACVNDQSRSEIITDQEGKVVVPSVVFFDAERSAVGEEARLRGRTMPNRLAACAKRDLGRDAYCQRIGGMLVPPAVIQAYILNHLRRLITDRIGADFSAAIGVPAEFNDAQRRAVVEAGKIAGLRMVDLINEPVAAALAYTEDTAFMQAAGSQAGPHNLLVFDLGGYTFEATAIRMDRGSFVTLATSRENALGGHDWDMRLVEHAAKIFQEAHGVDLRSDPVALDQLLGKCAKAKIALGKHRGAKMSLTRFDQRVDVTITRDEFARLTSDLVDRTAAIATQTLERAGLRWGDVARVLLVGGATRMPVIHDMIRAHCGREPDISVNPEEAVARGAALYAAQRLAAGRGAGAAMELHLVNMNTHSLGVIGEHGLTGEKKVSVLIPKGTTLPAKASREFVTLATGQKSIGVTIVECDDARPQACVPIGRAVIDDLPEGLTDRWPVEVTCEYAANGRIKIDAHVRYTDRTAHLEVVRLGGLTSTHVKYWREVVAAGRGLSGIREVLAKEAGDGRTAPIALAKSQAEAAEEPENVILTFLRRLAPFAFRKAATGDRESSELKEDQSASS